MAGAGAAVGSGIVKVPLAVCIRSVQAGAYPNAFAAARSIVDTAGARGLFTVSICCRIMKHAQQSGPSVPYQIQEICLDLHHGSLSSEGPSL